MMTYLWFNQVLLKNFGDHVEKVTERLKAASLAQAKTSGRPIEYLNSSHVDKDTIAHNILARDGVRSGLVCVLSCLEPCWKFEIHRSPQSKRLELQLRSGKCLFLYHYQIHPVFGFLNARIQTWFPFSIQICLNGREWLARQMQAAGLDYLQHDNCFPWIANWPKAQCWMDRQLKTQWPKLLNGIARQLNPIHAQIFRKHPLSYYWSIYQHEWALDVVFTHISGKNRLGRFTVRRKTIRKRMGAKLRDIKQQLRERMHDPVRQTGQWLKSIVQGHFNYYAVPGNLDSLGAFRHRLIGQWWRTLRRRSQKNPINWTRTLALADRWFPQPQVLHPYPAVRFAASHPR
jgi:hypothetical protein